MAVPHPPPRGVISVVAGRAAAFVVVMCGGAWTSPAAAQFVPTYSCEASQRFTLDWATQPPGAIGKGPRTAVLTNAAGRTVTLTYRFAGDVDDVGAVNVDGVVRNTPFVGAINTGGLGSDTTTLTIGATFDARQTSIDSDTDTAVIEFSTSVAVRDVAFTLLDVDYAAGQFADWIKVSATGPGGSFIPRLTTVQGNSNTGTPGRTAPGVAFVGPVTVGGHAVRNGEILGGGTSGSSQDYGNVAAQIVQPVTGFSVRYANGPASLTYGAPGQQAISIHDISFCPMPQLAMTKASAAVATSGADRLNVPGSLVDYTLTVSNTGGSPVDVDAATLIDALPANLTYMHVDVDPATAGTQNFAFAPGTSGLTMAAGDVTYAATMTGPFTLAPAAGANAGVRVLRFAPRGRMAANSSFTVRFRTRVD